MEEILRQHMVSCALAFCSARSIKVSTLGQRVVSDRRFFLRAGTDGTFTVRKYDVVMAWFSDHWPEHIAWPANVPRPSVSPPVVDAQVEPGAADVPPAPAAPVVSQNFGHPDSS